MTASRIPLLLCAAGVALGTVVLVLPFALYFWLLSPDSIGYIATAHNWVQGIGFVDPIVFTHYLAAARPPIPAFAVRPPLVSVLIAIPLALGADLTELIVTHVVWSGLIAGAAVLAASRSLSLPAATGFGIAVAWVPGFWLVAATPWTEVTAVGVMVLTLALLRNGVDSVRGALLLALVTLLGWMTRPNLGLLLAIVPLSVALTRGPTAALRSRPLWVYVGSFVLLHRAVVVAVTAVTGFAPYALYGLMAEILDVQQAFEYRREWVGPLPFLLSHLGEISVVLGENLQKAGKVLFQEGFYLWVGWLALPGLAFGLLRRSEEDEEVLELRFAAVGAVLFTAVSLCVYGGFDGRRYLLPGVVYCWFTIAALAGWGAERLADRLAPAGGGRPLAWTLRWLPALAALAAVATIPDAKLSKVRFLWTPLEHRADPHESHQQLLPLCELMDRDALVSSTHPWRVYASCGNAGLRVPNDLGAKEWLARYLDEQQPGYLLVKARRRWRRELERSPRLRYLEASGPWHLFEVVGAGPESRPWRAPPSLASLQRPGPGPAGPR